MSDLYWHCLQCAGNEAVAPTGDGNEYKTGDHEPCECGGTAHVVTIRTAACYEQGRALGMSREDAWERAKKQQACDAMNTEAPEVRS